MQSEKNTCSLELNEHYTKCKQEHLDKLTDDKLYYWKLFKSEVPTCTDYSTFIEYLIDKYILPKVRTKKKKYTLCEYYTDILALLVMYNKEDYFMKCVKQATNVNWEYILQLIVDVSPRPYLFLTHICRCASNFVIEQDKFEEIRKQIYDKREEYELKKTSGLEKLMSVEDWLRHCKWNHSFSTRIFF